MVCMVYDHGFDDFLKATLHVSTKTCVIGKNLVLHKALHQDQDFSAYLYTGILSTHLFIQYVVYHLS